jgi:catalase-peroxidase
MGPRARYLGPEVRPRTDLAGSGPGRRPPADRRRRHRRAQGEDPRLGPVRVSELVSTAWASASTFRGSDKRGGANGARIRLAPQKDWEVNQPANSQGAGGARRHPGGLQRRAAGGKKVSLADLIVLAAVPASNRRRRKTPAVDVTVPFTPGRTDASQEQTDVESFAVLEPVADGFRNYPEGRPATCPGRDLLVDKAQLLTLTAPEMTVLVGGLRVLGAKRRQPRTASSPPARTLTNDFFVNLLDMGTEWKPRPHDGVFEGRDRKTGEVKWTATRVDLVFGSNSQLRALAEVYASADARRSSCTTSSPPGPRS